MIYIPRFVTLFNNEKFYDIPYSDISGYAISESGKVISNKSGVWKEKALTKHYSGYLLVTFTTNTPGRKYCIYKTNVQKTYTLHKLLYSTFKSGKDHDRDEVIDHIDDNKDNNTISNLTLLDRYDNLYKNKKNKPKYIVYSVPDPNPDAHIDSGRLARIRQWTGIFEKRFDKTYAAVKRINDRREQALIKKTVEHIERHRETFEKRFDRWFKHIKLDKPEVLPILRPCEFLDKFPEYIGFTDAVKEYAIKYNNNNRKKATFALKEDIKTESISYHKLGKRYFILKTDI